MAWTREFDTTYQTHYWYDAATGASSWTEPPGWSEPSVEAENPETDRLTNKDDELELVDLGPRRRDARVRLTGPSWRRRRQVRHYGPSSARVF